MAPTLGTLFLLLLLTNDGDTTENRIARLENLVHALAQNCGKDEPIHPTRKLQAQASTDHDNVFLNLYADNAQVNFGANPDHPQARISVKKDGPLLIETPKGNGGGLTAVRGVLEIH